MSDMDPRDKLATAAEAINVPSSRVRAFLELAYTANESGLIPFSIHDDCAEQVLQLAVMAESFEASGVPDEFRM